MIRIQMKSQSDLTGRSNTGVVFQVMSKRSCPWHFRMSHAPGTWISSLCNSPHEQSLHWCSPHVQSSHLHSTYEQSSHIHRSASMGVSGITSVYRWCSPSHVDVFHHRKLAPGCLSHWFTQTQHNWCPLLVFGQSPSSMVGSNSYIPAESLWWQHRQSHVGQLAAWKMSYVFVLLGERNRFLYNFWCQSLGSQPVPADRIAGW